MNNIMKVVGWSNADWRTLALLIAIFAVLFMIAVLLEAMRRRATARRKEEAQWVTMREIASEKGIPDACWDALEGLIRRWAPENPLQAATSRHHFDRCVQQQMDSFMEGDSDEFENAGALLREARVYLGLDYIPFGQRIHSTCELYEGQQLWLAKAGKTEPHWMRFSVRAITEAHFIAAPAEKAVFLAAGFAKDQALQCRLWREDDARYSLEAKVGAVTASPPSLSFQHTSDLKRKQAREHFRIRFDESATVGVLSAPSDGSTDGIHLRPEVTQLSGQITSLSAGGLALVIQQALPKQVFLRIKLCFPDDEPIKVEARIVSTATITGDRVMVRAAYIGIDDETRDTIARYVLKRQQPIVSDNAEEKDLA